MKKFFTLLLMSVMTLAANAAITIYVQSEQAPNLWAWNNDGNLLDDPWPGHTLTDKKTVQGTEFWYYTFPESVTNVSILFNLGSDNTKTKDFTGIEQDRYFVYNGSSATDVTEQYGGVIPDAEVNSLGLAGNHNSWGTDDFDVVEAGKKFQKVVDLTGMTIEDDFWQFKIRPNKAGWVGYNQVEFDGDIPSWISDADNFKVDLEDAGYILTVTATWGGGKQADENWTLKVEKGNTAGIGVTTMEKKGNGETFNLQGQRVGNSYRGIVVEGGKKFLNK